MERLLRYARRIAGAALLAWSAWTILRPVLTARRPTIGVAVGTWGEPYELRIRPLTGDETARAIAAERDSVAAAWDGVGPAPVGMEP